MATNAFCVMPCNKIAFLYAARGSYIMSRSQVYIQDILPDIKGLAWVPIPHLAPGPWFNIKMTSYQDRKSHCGDKTVVRSSYLHNGVSYTGKMVSLYWIKAKIIPLSVRLFKRIPLLEKVGSLKYRKEKQNIDRSRIIDIQGRKRRLSYIQITISNTTKH